MKSKIAWIIDGVGWGYDILSKACSEKLTEYDHVMISMAGGNPASVIEEISKQAPLWLKKLT